jgi:hypothetical protein
VSPWRVKKSQTGRIRGVVAAAGSSIVAPEAAGGVAESQATILDRAERASASLDDRDRAGMPIRSNRRVTKRTTDWTIGVACCLDRTAEAAGLTRKLP